MMMKYNSTYFGTGRKNVDLPTQSTTFVIGSAVLRLYVPPLLRKQGKRWNAREKLVDIISRKQHLRCSRDKEGVVSFYAVYWWLSMARKMVNKNKIREMANRLYGWFEGMRRKDTITKRFKNVPYTETGTKANRTNKMKKTRIQWCVFRVWGGCSYTCRVVIYVTTPLKEEGNLNTSILNYVMSLGYPKARRMSVLTRSSWSLKTVACRRTNHMAFLRILYQEYMLTCMQGRNCVLCKGLKWVNIIHKEVNFLLCETKIVKARAKHDSDLFPHYTRA